VKQDFESIADYLPTYIDHLEEKHLGKNKVRGVSTGMRPLDQITGGLQRGKLYVIGARPGVGKTTICQNISYKAALKHQRRIGFFSVEMSKDDLMDRFMSMHTRINSLKLQNGDMEQKEWDRIGVASDELEKLGIFFEYTPGIYLDDLASMARRLVQKQEIDLLVIDYLQLLRARIDGKRIQPREMEIAEIARGLKMLAGELNVPILAPAQINRQVEHGAVIEDTALKLSFRMPMLADLRESGEIEQSADVVGFLARAEQDETKVRLQIAKHRGGPKGDIDLYFEGETTRFMPLQTQVDAYGNVIE
jgi:replicative DNA helicase